MSSQFVYDGVYIQIDDEFGESRFFWIEATEEWKDLMGPNHYFIGDNGGEDQLVNLLATGLSGEIVRISISHSIQAREFLNYELDYISFFE